MVTRRAGGRAPLPTRRAAVASAAAAALALAGCGRPAPEMELADADAALGFILGALAERHGEESLFFCSPMVSVM